VSVCRYICMRVYHELMTIGVSVCKKQKIVGYIGVFCKELPSLCASLQGSFVEI